MISPARPARPKRRGAAWIAVLLALLVAAVAVAALLLARAGDGPVRTGDDGPLREERQAAMRAAAALPADFPSYSAIDLSRERDRDPRHSGRSPLRARLPGRM